MTSVFTKEEVRNALTRIVPRSYGELESIEALAAPTGSSDMCVVNTIYRSHRDATGGLYGCFWLFWKDAEGATRLQCVGATRRTSFNIDDEYRALGQNPQKSHYGEVYYFQPGGAVIEDDTLVIRYTLTPTQPNVMTHNMGRVIEVPLSTLNLA